jgi:F-type H+-transporting ATPase subunit b
MADLFSTLINDTAFWVMVSTVLCFGFIALKAAAPIKAGLDSRAASITARLNEAEALRVEAQRILQEYKEKSENALEEAEAVLHNAQRRAELLREKMEQELKDSILRQEVTAKNRIARMEEDAIQTIKSKIISATLLQVKDYAAKEELVAPSIDHSLDDIKKILKK